MESSSSTSPSQCGAEGLHATSCIDRERAEHKIARQAEQAREMKRVERAEWAEPPAPEPVPMPTALAPPVEGACQLCGVPTCYRCARCGTAFFCCRAERISRVASRYSRVASRYPMGHCGPSPSHLSRPRRRRPRPPLPPLAVSNVSSDATGPHAHAPPHPIAPTMRKKEEEEREEDERIEGEEEE